MGWRSGSRGRVCARVGGEGERTIWPWRESKRPRNPLNCSLCMDNRFQNGGECKKFPFSQNTSCGHLLARAQTPEGPVAVNLWPFNVVWQSVFVQSATRLLYYYYYCAVEYNISSCITTLYGLLILFTVSFVIVITYGERWSWHRLFTYRIIV